MPDNSIRQLCSLSLCRSFGFLLPCVPGDLGPCATYFTEVKGAFLQGQFVCVSARHTGISILGPISPKLTLPCELPSQAKPRLRPPSLCAPCIPILLLRALRLHHLKPLEDLWRQEREQLPPFVRVHPAVSAGRRGASSRRGQGWLQAGFPCEAHRATNWHRAPQATEETHLGGWRPTGVPAGDPPSLATVDWALSRHCSASFSIFRASGGTGSPASGHGQEDWLPSLIH